MKRFFLKHAWLSFRRSPALSQEILQKVILGFFGLYIAVSLLVLSLVAGELLNNFFPGRNTIDTAGALLLYYLPFDILTRYFLQKFPTISIKPYLLLPIKKNRIIHYLLRRSVLNFFNFLPLFFTLPFYFVEVLPNASTVESVGFVLLVCGITLSSNFIAYWLSKASDFRNIYSGMVLVLLLLFLYLEYQGVLNFFPFFLNAASEILANPVFWILPLGLPILFYFHLFRYFQNKLSIEEDKKGSNGYGASIGLGFFERFGRAGRLMDLEVRLMIRSKRSRHYLILSLLFLFFPLLMTANEVGLGAFNYILFGLFMTGMIALNHGQLMLSWNSMHFDLLLSRGNTIKDIFRAKYYILALSCFITWVFTLPYLFMDPKIVLFSTALVTINASFSIFAYMVLASFNSLRIDPDQGNAMSFSGFGAAHYLIGIPIMLVPIIIYFGGAALGGMTAGVAALFLAGIVGLLFHPYVIDLCVKLFMENRYKISAAFRKE